MALEDLINAMEEEITAEINAVLNEARNTAAAKMQEAQRQAQELKNARLAQAHIDFAAEEARMKNAAVLAVAQEAHQVKKELVEQAFAQVGRSMETVRNSSDYADILATLVQEVQDAVGAELIWQVDPRDEAVLRSILGSDTIIEPNLNCTGGVVGVTRDGQIQADNTFAARLRKARELHISQIMAILTE